MRRRGIGWWLVTLGSVAVVGCADIGEDEPERTPYEQLDLAADTAEGYESDAAAPVVPVQGGRTEGGPLTATGNFRGIAEDAPPGTVTVTEEGDATRVLVSITRYTPGTELEAEIVQGDCQQPGDVVAQVGEPFTIGQDGIATYNAIVPIPTARLLNGAHSIRVTNPGQGPPQIVLACADLPAAEGLEYQ